MTTTKIKPLTKKQIAVTEQRRRDARSALRALQAGEVARAMGTSSTPEQIRRKADEEHKYLYWLAKNVEDLAALANVTQPDGAP